MKNEILIIVSFLLGLIPLVLYMICRKSTKMKESLIDDLDNLPIFTEYDYLKKSTKIMQYMQESSLMEIMDNSKKEKERFEKSSAIEKNAIEQAKNELLAKAKINQPLVTDYENKFFEVKQEIKKLSNERLLLAKQLLESLVSSHPQLVKRYNDLKAEEARQIEEQRRLEEEARREMERKARLKKEAEAKKRREEEEEESERRRRSSYSSSSSYDSSSSSSSSDSSSWGGGDGGGFSGGGASGDF